MRAWPCAWAVCNSGGVSCSTTKYCQDNVWGKATCFAGKCVEPLRWVGWRVAVNTMGCWGDVHRGLRVWGIAMGQARFALPWHPRTHSHAMHKPRVVLPCGSCRPQW